MVGPDEMLLLARFGDYLAAYCKALKYHARQTNDIKQSQDWIEIVGIINDEDDPTLSKKMGAAIHNWGKKIAANAHNVESEEEEVCEQALWICEKYVLRNETFHNGFNNLVSSGEWSKSKETLNQARTELLHHLPGSMETQEQERRKKLLNNVRNIYWTADGNLKEGAENPKLFSEEPASNRSCRSPRMSSLEKQSSLDTGALERQINSLKEKLRVNKIDEYEEIQRGRLLSDLQVLKRWTSKGKPEDKVSFPLLFGHIVW